MSEIEVLACFVIYSEERIVYQGTFQVSESPNSLFYPSPHSLFYPSKDGNEFAFTYSYEGKECNVELTCSNYGSTVAVCQLVIPINRTKRKWKKMELGVQYKVFYRCVFQDSNSKEMIKSRNKQRGRAATRGNRQDTSIINLFKVDSNSSGNGSDSA